MVDEYGFLNINYILIFLFPSPLTDPRPVRQQRLGSHHRRSPKNLPYFSSVRFLPLCSQMSTHLKMSKAWVNIGAWAAEEEERDAAAAAAAAYQNFPGLREAAATKPKKKKMALTEFYSAEN